MRHYHDLTVYHWKRDLHGLTVIGGWVKDTLERAWKRTLYIMPAGYYGEGIERIYFLIEEPGAHEIAVDAAGVGKMSFAYAEAEKALRVMDLADNLVMRHQVIGIINDHLDQLILMPPRPPVDQIEAADILITNLETGRTREAAVLDDA